MRKLIGLLIVGAAIGGFVAHKQRQEPPAPAPAVTAPTAPRETSEHNWAKRSLDRTNEVRRQVATKNAEDAP
ncbi:MAG: hypothetical protein ABIR71_07565 [Chthoniobacterales bacterium]